MYTRLLQPPKGKSFFLFGPRGTGKSSWVRAHFPEATYLDLLESDLYNDLLARPSRLEQLIPVKGHPWVIIDEVQRVPELLNEVHRLIEKRHCHFVLTGSSALTLTMHPLTACELGKDFKLDHSLRYGELPCVYTEDQPKQ